MKRILENIIHPQIGKERKKWTDQAIRRREKIICYDVPLLFETKGEKEVDEVISITVVALSTPSGPVIDAESPFLK